MTTQDKTQKAIEIVKTFRFKLINEHLCSQKKFTEEENKLGEALQHLTQIAERAGDEEGIIKIAINSLEKVYGYLRGYRESNVINAFREELAHSLSKWLKGEKLE